MKILDQQSYPWEKTMQMCGKVQWICWTAKASDHHYWKSNAGFYLTFLIANYWECLDYPDVATQLLFWLHHSLWAMILFFLIVDVLCF